MSQNKNYLYTGYLDKKNKIGFEHIFIFCCYFLCYVKFLKVTSEFNTVNSTVYIHWVLWYGFEITMSNTLLLVLNTSRTATQGRKIYLLHCNFYHWKTISYLWNGQAGRNSHGYTDIVFKLKVRSGRFQKIVLFLSSFLGLEGKEWKPVQGLPMKKIVVIPHKIGMTRWMWSERRGLIPTAIWRHKKLSLS